MWPKLRTLIVILSLSLNGAFLAVWLVGTVPVWLQQGGQQATARSQGTIWSPLHRELGVTAEQWQTIEPGLITFQKEAQEQRAIITASRAQVIELLASPQVDRSAIRARQDEGLSAMHRMQDLVIAHFLEEKALLSPEQQQKLFDIARRNNGSGCQTLSVEEPRHWFWSSLSGK